ncbi:MAG TPA: hypothetical protein VFM57_08220 [Thermoleophilaceae bacterium]|nr:hypothetical protein [Thermoleophilaceae bacterium]
MCGLVRRLKGEFGLLGAEVVEARLEANESVLASFGRELALLEGLVVAFQCLLGAHDLGADRGEPLLELGPSLLGVSVRPGECLADHSLVAVQRRELVDDCRFDFPAREPFAVARLRAVLLTTGTGVVVVAATVAVGAHADVRLAALPAAQEPGEDEVRRVTTPLRMLAALGEDRLRLGEGELVDERLVHTVKDLVAPADLPDVGRVVDDPVHAGVPPASGGCRRAFGAEELRDRSRAEPLARVEIEHAADDRRLHRVGDEHALLVREDVAKGRSAAEPASFLCSSFDASGDAVDDRGVLELGEHRQHLQHHPTCRRPRIERLSGGPKDDVERVEFFGELGELTHLPGEAVDAVDEQHVHRTRTSKVKCCLQAGSVKLGAGRLVLLVRDDSPALLRRAERLQPLAL